MGRDAEKTDPPDSTFLALSSHETGTAASIGNRLGAEAGTPAASADDVAAGS